MCTYHFLHRTIPKTITGIIVYADGEVIFNTLARNQCGYSPFFVIVVLVNRSFWRDSAKQYIQLEPCTVRSGRFQTGSNKIFIV